MTDDAVERPEANETSLERAVEKLRVLEEANAQNIKLIAEGHGARLDSLGHILESHTGILESHGRKLDLHGARLDSHGRKLDQIIQALAPLPEIRDFIERVAHEHEERIKALENPASR